MKLLLVVPCYNENKILPYTVMKMKEYLYYLIEKGIISNSSQVCFIDDGSKDKTWDVITSATQDSLFCGLKLSRNFGHQNAVLAGLLTHIDEFDCYISIDADLQDDIHAIESMIIKYHEGFKVVYGVRNNRETDSFFKRNSAKVFYNLLAMFGVEAIYNHADFRLMDKLIIRTLAGYPETNLFLRGIIPTIGYKSTTVEYKRAERLKGESKYPLKKMISLAWEGVTSFSNFPLKIIMNLGLLLFVISFSIGIWAFSQYLNGKIVPGWTSTFLIIMGFGAMQMISIGILGQYIGKLYMEVKARPRFIIEQQVSNSNKIL